MEGRMREFEAVVGYEFRDKKLLEQALTHSSAPVGREKSYERLEFLGDAVLKSLVTDILFHRKATSNEQMSVARDSAISDESMSRIGEKISIDRYLRMKKGESPNVTIRAGAVEALIGAIYWDAQKMAPVRAFVEKYFDLNFNFKSNPSLSPKVLLQNYCAANGVETVYSSHHYGSEHDGLWELTMSLDGKQYGPCRARSKDEAKKELTKLACKDLELYRDSKSQNAA